MSAGSILTRVVGLVATVAILSSHFHGSSWQNQSASSKMSAVWSKLTSNTNSADWYSTLELGQLFIESMDTSFDTVADDLPMQFFGTTARKKLIHTVGAVAQAKWVKVGNHAFTGMFGDGCDNLLIRISAAKKPTPDDDSGWFVPGLSIKCFRDNVKSCNFLSMYSLSGQNSFNIVKNDWTNHPPDVHKSFGLPQQLLRKKFATASDYPVMLGLSDCAAKHPVGGGEVIPSAEFPFRVVFVATDQIRSYAASHWPDTLQGGSDNYMSRLAQLNGLYSSGQLHLFDVYAEENPHLSAVENRAGWDSFGMEKIGEVVATSHLTPSNFGDLELFYQHQRFEDDLEYHNEWKDDAEDILKYQRDSDAGIYSYPNMN